MLPSSKSTQRSILSLDKSTAPFSVQIQEACDFLGVKLPEPSIHTQRQYNAHGGDSRTDWTLRWLLKNFQSPKLDTESPSLNPQAWLLLSKLIACTPLTTASRLLNTFKFPILLRGTLQCLEELAVGKENTGKDQLTSSSVADTNSTTFEIAQEEGRRKSKKRKRDGEQSIPTALRIQDLCGIFISIISTLDLVLDLANGPSAASQGFAVEHLKAALKISPDDATDFLSSSFTIVNALLLDGGDEPGRNTLDEVLISLVSSIINYWEQSWFPAQNSDTYIQRDFSKKCLLLTLRLLEQVDERLNSTLDKERLVQALESLVIRNAIEPARLSLLNAMQPQDRRDPIVPTDFTEGSLIAITDPDLQALIEGTKAPAAMFFNIAIQCRPRSTPKERRTEHSWLQRLFVYFAETLSFFDSSTQNDGHRSKSIMIIHDMLYTAFVNGIRFDAPVLERLLGQVFEHFDRQVTAQWSMIQLCMEMDPKVFVSASRPSAISGKTSQGVPNMFLQSLFERITERGNELRSDSVPLGFAGDIASSDHEAQVQAVITQLVPAFAKSRELIRFIHHWREQLIACQRSDSIWDASIWEQPELQQKLKEMLEPCTIVEQIEKLLMTVKDDLAAIRERGPLGIVDTRAYISHMIVLDCVLSGCTIDSTIHKLMKVASECHDVILQLLAVKTAADRCFKSSSWKVLATINGRWPTLEGCSRQSFDGAKIAFATLVEDHLEVEEMSAGPSRTPTKADKERKMYGGKFHAFRFLWSFASMVLCRDGFTADIDVHNQVMIWLKTILDHFAPSEVGKVFVRDDTGPLWDVWSEPVTKDGFAIALLALMVQSPGVLQCLARDVQSHVFRALYDYAFANTINSSRSEQARSDMFGFDRTYHYKFLPLQGGERSTFSRRLWTKFTQSILEYGKGDMRAHFCDFQVAKYLQHSDYDIEKLIEVEVDATYAQLEIAAVRANDVALELLQITPMALFTKVQRTNISNRILQQLVSRKFGIGMIAEALHLMHDLVRTPSNSMIILKEPTWITDSNNDQDTRSHVVTLIAIARWLDDLIPEFGVCYPTVMALKSLAIAVVEYLASISSQRRLAYIEGLVHHLDAEFDREPSAERSAITSAMIGILLGFYRHYEDAVSEDFKHAIGNLQDVRRAHCLSLLESVLSICSGRANGVEDPESDRRMIFLLQITALYTEQINTDMDVHNQWANLELTDQALERLSTLCHQLEEDGELSSSQLIPIHMVEQLIMGTRRRKQKQLLSSDDHAGSINNELQRLKGCSSARRVNIIRGFQEWASALRSEEVFGMLNTITEVDEGGMDGYDGVLVVECLLAILIGRQQTTDEIKVCLSRMFTLLGRRLLTASATEVLVVAARSMDMILKSQSNIVAQHHIDSLLSSMAVAASRVTRTAKARYVGTPYHVLCRLFSTVLLLHRKKLGGRYHLIVRALQSLLRCLFVPYAKSETQSMDPDQAKKDLCLGPNHAAAFARILTALCDPTLSSVSRSKHTSRDELNDETKKARSIAGQHLQYLIEEYCECQLAGRLSAEMKAALNPGLYAVFAVMPQDVMRNLNAAMTSSSRSIFKALYDEYKRFGR